MGVYEIDIATAEYIEVVDPHSGFRARQYIRGRRPDYFTIVSGDDSVRTKEAIRNAAQKCAIDYGRSVRFID